MSVHDHEPSFKDMPFKEKILIVLIAIPTYIYVIYFILRVTFDKKKRQEWIDRSHPDYIEDWRLKRPDDDASEEEWDAYYRSEDAELTQWEKDHRVSRFFLNVLDFILTAIFDVYDWFSRRKEARGSK